MWPETLWEMSNFWSLGFQLFFWAVFWVLFQRSEGSSFSSPTHPHLKKVQGSHSFFVSRKRFPGLVPELLNDSKNPNSTIAFHASIAGVSTFLRQLAPGKCCPWTGACFCLGCVLYREKKTMTMTTNQSTFVPSTDFPLSHFALSNLWSFSPSSRQSDFSLVA